jgi:hypothetical protein
MRDASGVPVKIDLGASAKVNLDIKAEIPPEAAGRFTDAITKLLSPWSEARALKADLIRLHREEVAFEIAKRAARRLNFEKGQQHPIPLKVLVPLLEKGSQEDAGNDYMIDMWANLLASTATHPSTSPRLVAILSEMTGREARLLADIAAKPFDSSTCFTQMNHFRFSGLVRHVLSSPTIEPDSVGRCLVWRFKRSGTFLHHIQVVRKALPPGEAHLYWADPSIKSAHFEDLQVLTSLGLLDKIDIEEFPDGEQVWCVRLKYYVLTHLAVYLLNAVMPELDIPVIRVADDQLLPTDRAQPFQASKAWGSEGRPDIDDHFNSRGQAGRD